MLPEGSWLGCLGGGQLGRMFVHAAQALGYKVRVLDPDGDGPAAQAADDVIVAGYDDAAAIAAFGKRVAAVTTEFENVPAASLDALAAMVPTRPGAAAVRIAQDRRLEKRFFTEHDLPVGPFAAIGRAEDLRDAPSALFPGILKTATLGYDGKGQQRVSSSTQALLAWMSMKQAPCVLEALVAFELEISVLVARSVDGDIRVWPVQENQHINGILDLTIVPARIDETLREKAQTLATRLVTSLDYVGVLCVEMFVTKEAVLLNEIAPRPHNSGHYTIDACETSQFEQQVRVLVGAPLGDTSLLRAAVMVNVLGDVWFDAATAMQPAWADVLALPGTHLHLYGKAEPRKARKMGHITCTAASVAAALETAAAVKRVLRIA